MKYTIPDLDNEITKKAEWLILNNGKTLHKGWLVNSVMADHDDIQGDDAEFARCLSIAHVTKRVEHYFRKAKADERNPADPQMVLPGYTVLQRMYIIERDDELVGVPVGDATNDELRGKEKQMRAMGDGLYKHADEIQRYIQERADMQTAQG